MDEIRTSPETGQSLRRGIRPLTLSYKSESITVDMPGWYGEEEEDGIHSGEDMKVSDRALNRLKARTDGLLAPEDIRRIRKKLGLSQVEAGEVIGGGPRAFQKYEAGDALASKAISTALLLLERDPKALRFLKERQHGTPSSVHDAPHR